MNKMTDKERYEKLEKMTADEANEFLRQEDLRTPQKIDSHCNWYRGKWEKDICRCGQAILVPIRKIGWYQCNDCADRAEGGGY